MTEEEFAKLVAEVAKELTKDIYGDALKPGMTQVGKAIETVLGLGNTVLTPITMVNDNVKHIRKKNLLKLDQKLKTLDPEKVVDVHPEIAVPVLKKLEYTQNAELADLFLNLLTTASNIDTAHFAHPAFVNVISNLTPDEAKIIRYLDANHSLCHLNIKTNNLDGTFSSYRLSTTVLEFEDIIEFRSNSQFYISNLLGLGIIGKFACPSQHPQVDKIKEYLSEEWETIEKRPEVKNLQYLSGAYSLTEFGELFVKCCTKNDEAIILRMR